MESHPDVHLDRIIAVGGGTQNPVWMQIIADILGKPVDTPLETVGACFGDAMMAALAVKHPGFESYASLTSFIKPGRTYEPDMEKHKVYETYQKVYRALYESTKSLAHTLSDAAVKE